MTSIRELVTESGVAFGTSGARGLVSALSDRVSYAYTRAFLQALSRTGELGSSHEVAIGGDLRESTGRIMRAVAAAARDGGFEPVNAGRLPSPALAAFALRRRIPGVMVTGSHIPEDRNGIKFTKPGGELLKSDEQLLLAEEVELGDAFDGEGALRSPRELPQEDPLAAHEYVGRWSDAFPAGALGGRRVVLYAHSAVGRELLTEILGGLGAQVIVVGWSERFVPVDTEAIRPEDVAQARRWAEELAPFAIVSTDGDADRPLVADERGRWLRGDVAGILCARYLRADVVVTPVSCNGAVELSGWFDEVVRTRIGSPYVVEAMTAAVRRGGRRVVGYEANGGFLTATDLALPTGLLPALPTRDPVIVILSLLCDAAARGRRVSELVTDLPRRSTASARLENFSAERAAAKLAELVAGGPRFIEQALALGPELGPVMAINTVDGLRVTFASRDIVHLRPSGNAPELRCYTEADGEPRALELLARALARLEAWR